MVKDKSFPSFLPVSHFPFLKVTAVNHFLMFPSSPIPSIYKHIGRHTCWISLNPNGAHTTCNISTMFTIYVIVSN